jgi:hypothetical protein
MSAIEELRKYMESLPVECCDHGDCPTRRTALSLLAKAEAEVVRLKAENERLRGKIREYAHKVELCLDMNEAAVLADRMRLEVSNDRY